MTVRKTAPGVAPRSAAASSRPRSSFSSVAKSGIVTTKKIGRVRTCRLGQRRLEAEAAWLEQYRQLWDARFDELDKVVEELTRKDKSDERTNRT